jgi:hypothetical protein
VWGIPCVRLQWLLDSIARRSLQPTAPYLLAAAQQDGQQRVGLELQLPDSCHQLKSCNRPPSSTASNDVAADAGSAERQEAASCQHQRVQRQEGLGRQPLQPSPLPRAAFAPLHNTVLNQLQRMSLSPRAAPPPPTAQPTAAAWPGSSPPEQCSPAGSPQLSLSLQGLLADGEAEAVPRQNSCSLGEASSKGLVAGGQPQGSPFYSPGVCVCGGVGACVGVFSCLPWDHSRQCYLHAHLSHASQLVLITGMMAAFYVPACLQGAWALLHCCQLGSRVGAAPCGSHPWGSSRNLWHTHRQAGTMLLQLRRRDANTAPSPSPSLLRWHCSAATREGA